MFAFVKKLFGKSSSRASESTVNALQTYSSPFPQRNTHRHAIAPVERAVAPVAAVPAGAVAPAVAANGTARNGKPAAAVAATAVTPEPKASAVLIPESEFSKETLDLPLKQLWAKLSTELVNSATEQPNGDAFLKLPLNLVQAHLARGSVKIPFRLFRQFSPTGFFNGNRLNDAAEIVLPISDILARVKPEHLPRRADQKKIHVPEDIEPIFGPDAGKKGKVRLAAPEKAKVPSAAVAPSTAVPVQDGARAFVSASVAPSVAENTGGSAQSRDPGSPPPEERPLVSEPLRAPGLDPALATLRAVPSPVPPSKTKQEETLNIALMDIAGYWAEKGRMELENLYRHSLDIPTAILETALKRGKVEFAWREVRVWVRLAPGNSMPRIDDEARVELPLSIIAPRFLEQQRKGAPKKRVEVSAEIPDVFVKSAVPEAEPERAAQLAPAPAYGGCEPSTGPCGLGKIFGQPEKNDWTLPEISQRASILPGVAGAIIATSDGLLVGGQWPGAESETVAAFVPQMYSRMTSYMKELQLGEPNHLTLMIENVPLKIFKSADSYFTVLGRAGESLPTTELNAIAARLAASLTEN